MQRLCVQGKVTDFMVISKRDMPQPTIYKRTRSRRRSLEAELLEARDEPPLE